MFGMGRTSIAWQTRAACALVLTISACNYPEFQFVPADVGVEDASLGESGDATVPEVDPDTAGPDDGAAGDSFPETGAEVGKDAVADTSDAGCGDAGTICADRATCTAGVCRCPGDVPVCGTQCVDVATDTKNCGTCGKVCGGDAICNGRGECWCRPWLDWCSAADVCTDFNTDPRHCGSCAKVCAAGESCSAGVCTGACPTGRTKCPIGAAFGCVDLANDFNNCGACGKRCPNDQFCHAGACVPFVPALGCTKCPCTASCAAAFPTGSTCCNGFFFDDKPVCVKATGFACP